MKVIEKLVKRNRAMQDNEPITIAFLGDSVTQGCFELYRVGEKGFNTIFESESSYSAKVRKILTMLFPMAQINIINAGISGGNARTGLERVDRDVIKFAPDLTVVSFGTNDAVGGKENVDFYASNLRNIFQKLKDANSEVVFLVPHMTNDIVSLTIQDAAWADLAERNKKVYNDGVLDLYYQKACDVAKEMDVKICDCYSLWKTMNKAGVNTTELLSNKVNHPNREMHLLFAIELVKTFFLN